MARTPIVHLALTLATIAAMTGCPAKHEDDSCGARVRFLGASGREVTLEVENVSAETIQVGGSSLASFVDTGGNAMTAQMRGNQDDWFMTFALPAKSKRTVVVALTQGGEPEKLDRIEIPHSGASRIPQCTIKASGLAR